MANELLQKLDSLSKAVKRSKAVNINSRAIKESAVAIGSFYFSNARKEAFEVFGESDLLKEYDSNWQYLIRLAQGNNSKNSYLNIIRKLIRAAKEINVGLHSATADIPEGGAERVSYSDAEQILIETLEQILPSASASYQQAIQEMSDQRQRLSYRGTASELREALRETLDHLAPDDDVMGESWFKFENGQKRPTMKQKVKFILLSRGRNKTEREPAENTIGLIEKLYGELTRSVYNRASLSTHVKTTREEVIRLKRYMDALLFDLLEIRQA
jgi:hypothetical protein